MAKTLYDKLWDAHAFATEADGTSLLYIDRHIINEVSSPQAFEALRLVGRTAWRPASCLAIVDHNVPTTDRSKGITDPLSRKQVDALESNSRLFKLTYVGERDPREVRRPRLAGVRP